MISSCRLRIFIPEYEIRQEKPDDPAYEKQQEGRLVRQSRSLCRRGSPRPPIRPATPSEPQGRCGTSRSPGTPPCSAGDVAPVSSFPESLSRSSVSPAGLAEKRLLIAPNRVPCRVQQSFRCEYADSLLTASCNRWVSDSFRASSHKYRANATRAVARKMESEIRSIMASPGSDLDPDDLADGQHPEDLQGHSDRDHDPSGPFEPKRFQVLRVQDPDEDGYSDR